MGDFSKLPLFVKKNVGKEPLSVKSGKPAPMLTLGLKAKFGYKATVCLLKWGIPILFMGYIKLATEGAKEDCYLGVRPLDGPTTMGWLFNLAMLIKSSP